jgi:hypothetical protein
MDGWRTYLSCAICETRKEKRFCPAVHGRICPVCCGEQREVTLNCPSDCPYLLQAREHEKTHYGENVDPAELFLKVEIGDQFLYEHEHLVMGLSFALARAADKERTLTDRDVIAGTATLARGYERLVNSGLHYEEPTQSLVQQAVSAELQTMIKEYREAEQKHTGYSRLRDSEILKTLVFLVRMGYGRSSGRPKSRAFIDFLKAQFPERESALNPAGQSGSRIIAP